MAETMNASIVEHFQTLEDPRIERTTKHLLLDILVIAVCTLLTGGEGVQDRALFGKSKRTWLQTFLALPHGIPSHDTFGRVFARLNPQRFQECFLSWTQAVAQLTQGTLISLDGKTVTLNLSQFVEGRRGWPWAREGREEAHVFAGDEPCTAEEICRASARFDALQNVII